MFAHMLQHGFTSDPVWVAGRIRGQDLLFASRFIVSNTFN